MSMSFIYRAFLNKNQYPQLAKLNSVKLKLAFGLVGLVSVLIACAPQIVSDHAVGRQLKCTNPEKLAGHVIGDGHCVALIKACSGAPNTPAWRPGKRVWQNNIAPGTIIATFKNQRYPNKTGWHAAIFIKQDERGIWVWDQWLGKSVHKRLIRYRNDGAAPGNTAQAYRTVEINR